MTLSSGTPPYRGVMKDLVLESLPILHSAVYVKLQLTAYLFKYILSILRFPKALRAPRACSRRRVLFEAYTAVSFYCSTKKSSPPSPLAACD